MASVMPGDQRVTNRVEEEARMCSIIYPSTDQGQDRREVGGSLVVGAGPCDLSMHSS